MPFCRYCGAEHPAEARFCPVCGRPAGDQPRPGAGGAAWPAEYPVLLAIDNAPRHSRLTALFRLFLLIPHAIVIAFYAFAALVVALVAWFAIMFTGRYPRAMFDFQVGYLRYATRFNCFAYMLTSGFPPFGPGSNDDGYPVRLSVIYPERLSRVKTFFRPILAIPGYFIQWALSVLASVLAVVAWFVIIFTGKLPEGMHSLMATALRYYARYTAFALLLLTDELPWFQEEAGPD